MSQHIIHAKNGGVVTFQNHEWDSVQNIESNFEVYDSKSAFQERLESIQDGDISANDIGKNENAYFYG